MKLCHIVPSLEEQYGGPSKSVRALCGALAARHDVDLLITHPGTPAENTIGSHGRLRISAFSRNWPRRICRSAGLRRKVQATACDIVHHHSLWLRTLHYAHSAASGRAVPLVVSPRGMMSDWAWQHRPWRKQLARVLVHPGAFGAVAGWHATSAAEAREIGARGFPQPVCVAPNGIAPAAEAERESARAHWHRACPAAANARVAVFYSRLHRKKRVLELVALWRELAPPDWLLLLVGIPQDYSPADLERHAAAIPGTGRIAVFDGQGQPPPHAAASLFLLPSHNENFGLAIAEAMAHGVPVLVTDTTPWREVQQRGLGWCVPWNDYAMTLRTALQQSPEALATRGARAREWVLGEFSWDRSARLLTDFYSTLTRHSR